MVKNNYANAYKEVLAVINNLVKEDYEKIPKEYIEFFKINANPDYNFKYDNSKSFSEQNLLDDTKYILFGLFEKFGTTEKQKTKIKTFKTSYYTELEKQKRKKYNPNDIFKKNIKKEIEINEMQKNMQIAEYIKPKWYQKIYEKIKKILKNNKEI